ncbi:MAG: hypothetical protein JO085_06165 [Acidimicrobiia bacterium]|nr:hypothetical protein [Acidimicrobiia bacterium]
MAAVATLALVGLALWTVLSFAVSVAIGRTFRRMETIPVRTSSRRIVDLRNSR